MSRAAAYRIAVVAALGMLLVVGCGGAERGESGEIVEGGSLSVFSFRAGDCLNGLALDGEDVTSVTGIPCDQPHEAEVYLLVDHPGGSDAPFPGREAIVQFAEERCIGAFESYVGLSYELSEIYATYLFPIENSWPQGDREIVCLLYEDGRQITGSLRDAAR